jgi:threonine aldolase
VGSTDVIAEAHRLRKRLGGGMRHAGVIAAAARVALETGPGRLADDHVHARWLAETLAELNPRSVDMDAVETNMIYVDLGAFDTNGTEVSAALRSEGVLTLGGSGTLMRLVTHRDVTSGDVETVCRALRKVLKTP